MSGFEATWAEATTDGSQDDAPPDGKHDAALVDADAFTSKAGDDFVKLSFQTVDKQHTWDVLGGFKSPKAAGFTKGQCQIVGVQVDKVSSLDELGQELKKFVGGFYEVDVERNGSYVNTYVREGAVPDIPADTAGLEQATPAGSMPWDGPADGSDHPFDD